jgi:hypothetical protein
VAGLTLGLAGTPLSAQPNPVSNQRRENHRGHRRSPVPPPAPELIVKGAENPADFAEEASGRVLVATVTGLEPGPYAIEIDLAETEYRGEGLRVMGGSTI